MFKKRHSYFLTLFIPIFALILADFCYSQDLIAIEKFSRTLYFYRGGQILKAYPVSLGWNAEKPKKAKGDGATPEGVYEIIAKRPSKKYGRFWALNYPNLKDVNLAWWEGRLSYEEYLCCLEAAERKTTDPRCPLGFGVGIHGGGLYRTYEGKRTRDWTFGCVALNDQDLAELDKLVSVGTPVIIYNLKQPLFETLKQFVFPLQVPGIRLTPWWGEWEFDLEGFLLRASLWEDHQGARRLILMGFDVRSKRLLFYYRDDNADGVLSPWEEKSVLAHPFWGYEKLQQKILEVLPLWVERKIEKKRGG